MPFTPELQQRDERDVRRADAARAGLRRPAPRPGPRRHPDVHVRHRRRDRKPHALPGRLAPPPRDRDRRPAGLQRLRARCRRPPAPRLWGYDRPGHRHRSRAARGRVGPLRPARRRRETIPRPPSTRCSPTPSAAPTPSPRSTRARSPRSTAPGLVAAMNELAEIEELAGRAGTYVHLAFSVDTADPAHGALLQRVEEKGTAIETDAAVLPPRVGGARRRARRGAAGHRRAGLRPPPPRHGAPLPPAPAERARGADPRREGDLRPLGLGAAVRGADGGDHGRAARRTPSRSRSRSRSRGCSRPTASSAATPPSASPPALEPGLRTRAYAFNTLLADKMTDDRLRSFPHWLAAAQPVQRGLRRVRARR